MHAHLDAGQMTKTTSGLMTVGRTDGEPGERLLILSRSVYNATNPVTPNAKWSLSLFQRFRKANLFSTAGKQQLAD